MEEGIKEIRFGENLKRLRKGLNLTQNGLASLLSVDQRTISAWENGVCEPDFKTLLKLLEIFNVDLNGLLL